MRNAMRASFKIFFLLCLFGFLALAQTQKNGLTLDDIFNSSKFIGKTVSGVHWLKDGSHYSYYERDTSAKATNIFVFGVKEKTSRLLLSTAALKFNQNDPPFRFTTYQWSPDEKQILFISAPPEREYLSRLTPAGNIFLYDATSKAFRRFTNVTEPQYNVKFSPDGRFVGFVRNNNIYTIDIASGVEHQLTTDGAEHIINGKFDWVDQEEFEISDGWQWSPDSKHIAFWRLDEKSSSRIYADRMGFPASGVDPHALSKSRGPQFDCQDWRRGHPNFLHAMDGPWHKRRYLYSKNAMDP